MKLFGSVKGTVFLVCDRYVAYSRMARELDGKVILCWCWIHQRRDFIECAAGQAKLRQWCEEWIERFASLCRLNKERLKHYDPVLGIERRTPAFDAAQDELKKAVDELFVQAEAELAGLSAKARQGKALRSLLKHREGLSVFVDNPQVPMDNNVAERQLRSAVIGRRLCFGSDSEDGAGFTATMYSVLGTLDEVRPLDMRIVVRNTREGKLWNEFVARYHYLGYKPLVGAQMRYAVHDRNGWPLAMLGFSTAAWKLAPRDRFIGWTPQLREKNLPLVVDNPRFLILPWIEIPNLGSHTLALVRRHLPEDWAERYNTAPVMIETFVETPRYTGTVYQASGWTLVGTTQGRGRYDRYNKRAQPKKDIWLRPLRKDWKRTLNR